MKKIITMMTLVAVAISTQAASVQWAVTGNNPIRDINDAFFDEGTVLDIYLVLSSYIVPLKGLLNSGNFADDSPGVAMKWHTDLDDNVGVSVSVTADSPYIANTAPDSPQSFAILVFATFNIEVEPGVWEDVLHYQISAASAPVHGYDPATQGPTEVTFRRGDFNPANWTPIIIPEPASALLGLAGIGLLIAQKRKRA